MRAAQDPMCDRVRSKLTGGLVIAGRKFEFLAFSTSQLREQAAWFFSPLPQLAIPDIHRYMDWRWVLHHGICMAAQVPAERGTQLRFAFLCSDAASPIAEDACLQVHGRLQ